MPYIPQAQRHELDPVIAELAEKIKGFHDGQSNASIAGVLNYAITRLILDAGRPARYHDIAILTGVLENVKQEFYRKFASDYEDAKIKENGAVYQTRP